MGVVGGELVKVREQRRGLEGVDAGVDLTDSLLRRREGFLLDDGFDFRRIWRLAQNPPVAGGAGGSGGQNRHCRLLGLVKLPELLDRLRPDERHIAGKHQNVLVAGDGFACALDGVAGAALLCLLDEADARCGHCCLHPLCLVTDHGIDVARSHNLAGGGNHVGQQRLAANLVQHLGPLRLQPRPLARRHDDHGQLCVPFHASLPIRILFLPHCSFPVHESGWRGGLVLHLSESRLGARGFSGCWTWATRRQKVHSFTVSQYIGGVTSPGGGRAAPHRRLCYCQYARTGGNFVQRRKRGWGTQPVGARETDGLGSRYPTLRIGREGWGTGVVGILRLDR